MLGVARAYALRCIRTGPIDCIKMVRRGVLDGVFEY